MAGATAGESQLTSLSIGFFGSLTSNLEINDLTNVLSGGINCLAVVGIQFE